MKLVGQGPDQTAASAHHMATIEGFLFVFLRSLRWEVTIGTKFAAVLVGGSHHGGGEHCNVGQNQFHHTVPLVLQ